jgi:hypothetical protein
MIEGRGLIALLSLLLLGLALGLLLSLAYVWLLNPIQRPVSAPSDLKPELKEDYIVLIASAYAVEDDLDRARERLAGLGDPDAGRTAATLAERHIAAGRSVEEIRSLSKLAVALGAKSGSLLVYISTPTPTNTPASTATPTATPTLPTATPTPIPSPTDTPTPIPPTATPSPTRTPTPAPQKPTPTRPPETAFKVIEHRPLCNRPGGSLEVYVRDAEGEGISGVELIITWAGKENYFFTGLKPEIDPGYADFQMEQGVTYRLALAAEPNLAVENVGGSADCLNLADDEIPSWRVVVQERQRSGSGSSLQ